MILTRMRIWRKKGGFTLPFSSGMGPSRISGEISSLREGNVKVGEEGSVIRKVVPSIRKIRIFKRLKNSASRCTVSAAENFRIISKSFPFLLSTRIRCPVLIFSQHPFEPLGLCLTSIKTMSSPESVLVDIAVGVEVEGEEEEEENADELKEVMAEQEFVDDEGLLREPAGEEAEEERILGGVSE